MATESVFARVANETASILSCCLATGIKLTIIKHRKIWCKHPAAIAQLSTANGDDPARVGQNINEFTVLHEILIYFKDVDLVQLY